MDFRKLTYIFVVGIALFSMFFGGGNLTFPLWIGIQTTSLTPTTLGFLISGVLLPFYGVVIGLYFKGDYEKLLGVWGKTIGAIFTFLLLLFWIPLGSGPRCNQLAYGAFSQMGWSLPFWIHSAIYSVIVYMLTYRKRRILDILGDVITPILLVSLILFVYLGVVNAESIPTARLSMDWSEFTGAFQSGYLTMDFIAAIFFTSTIISLVRAKKGPNYPLKSIYYSCLIGIVCLSVVYIGMIFVGDLNSVLLSKVSRDQLLAALGKAVFHERYHFLMFVVITLSCLTTSVALAFVFAEYMRKTLFQEKLGHRSCLAISIFISFALSTVGFEPLAVLITYAMSTLYPFLLLTTTVAFVKKLSENRSPKKKHSEVLT